MADTMALSGGVGPRGRPTGTELSRPAELSRPTELSMAWRFGACPDSVVSTPSSFRFNGFGASSSVSLTIIVANEVRLHRRVMATHLILCNKIVPYGRTLVYLIHTAPRCLMTGLYTVSCDKIAHKCLRISSWRGSRSTGSDWRKTSRPLDWS